MSVSSAPHTAWSKPPGTYGDRASSLAWPPGPCPQSWPRAIASVERDVQPERAGDGHGDLGHLEGMGEAGALVVVGEDEHLGLAGESAERGRVQDAVAVALEARTQRVGLLLDGAVAGAVGAGGQRRQAASASSSSRARAVELIASSRCPPTSRRGPAGTSPASTPPIVDAHRAPVRSEPSLFDHVSRLATRSDPSAGCGRVPDTLPPPVSWRR